MNTKITVASSLIFAWSALFCGTALAASREHSSPMMYRASQIDLSGHEDLRPGLSRNAVRAAIGSPAEQVTPNIWLYHGFKPDLASAKADECYELLIAFENDRVTEIYFVNPAACQVIVARANSGFVENGQVLAAGSPSGQSARSATLAQK